MVNDEYENIIAIIESGFHAINDNYDLFYRYIHKLAESNPQQAAELELMVLEQVPKDNSILQKMEELRQIIES